MGLSRRELVVTAAASAVALGTSDPLQAAGTTPHLAGLFPIGFTPERKDGKVDFDGLAAQVDFCRRGGVPGLIWPQYASGWTLLSEPERLKGMEVILDAARGGAPAIVIGVQSTENDFAEIERYARAAEKHGAAAIICLPPGSSDPSRLNLPQKEELISFYRRVGNLTGLPLMGQTVGDFSIDSLIEVMEATPTFRLVKEEAGKPLQRIGEIIRRTSGTLKVFSGSGAATLISEMELGFSGHCPFTSLADVFAHSYELFHTGKRREAFDIFGRILAACSMFSQGDIDVLIARGVFRPGTTARSQLKREPTPAQGPEQIKRVLDTYLAQSLRA